jgi:anti-sigma regulatory factor (Ser/Thr protein kinase)
VLQVLDLENVFACDSLTVNKEPVPTADVSPRETNAAYQDAFAPTPEGIDAAITRFLEYMSQLRVPELALFELRIVIYEITTNIMCHSALSALDRIGMDARVDASGLTLEFSDPGPAFDPTAQTVCTDYRKAGMNHQSHGFGLAMVHGLVDEVEYMRNETNNNVLTVKKRWSADA